MVKIQKSNQPLKIELNGRVYQAPVNNPKRFTEVKPKPVKVNNKTKSQLWEIVKKRGNEAQLTWQTPIQTMRDNITNPKWFKPLKVYNLGRTREFINRAVKSEIYQIKNWKQATKYNLVPLLKKLPENTTIDVGVILPSGQTQVRNIKAKKLIEAVENDFHVMAEGVGSDNVEELEYTIDISREFRIRYVINKNDIQNFCNSTQNRVRTVGRCQVRDVYTRHHNCGFQVLKALGYVTDIKPAQQKGLSINEMVKLCTHYNFPVKIIDTEGYEQWTHPEFSDHTKTIVVSIEEQHYYIFLGFTMSKEEKRENLKEEKRKQKEQAYLLKAKKIILVFYDVESVFNALRDNMAQTYSVAYFPIPLTNEMETITPQNLNKFIQQTKIQWGEDCCKEMVNDLHRQYSADQYTYKFISFNGSCFDDYFLMDQAVHLDEYVRCIFSNKSIIGLTLPYGKCWDLRKFLAQGSLKSLCESFQTFPEKVEGYDHRTPQKEFENGTLKQWIKENKDKVTHYNKIDVLALYSLTLKFRAEVLKLFTDSCGVLVDDDADVFNHDTVGGQAFKLCKNQWKAHGIKMKRPKTEECDKYIRKCLTAGRTQVMSTKDGSAIHLKGKFQMIDVVSLYPTVMLNPQNYYPCGEQTEVTTRNPEKLGFYHIRVKQREDLPNVLPQRDYEGLNPLNWNIKEEYETYCCSIDLDVLAEYGHEYTIIDGIEFSDKISGMDLFACQLKFRNAKVIQDVNKSERPSLYNSALREVCKLYLNSLSGKVIQRNFERVNQIVRNSAELNKFIDQCHGDSVTCHTANQKFVVLNGKKLNPYGVGAKPSYLGVYIYAHARKLMYTKIYTKVKCHYTDTDSALIRYEDYEQFRKDYPEMFATETIELDGKNYEIKPFGSLDCEMKGYDQTREQFQQNEWAMLYNESEENQQQIYEARKRWVGCTDAYLLAPKNYLAMNPATRYIPKLKCKGVSFNGSHCQECKQSLQTDNIHTLERLQQKCQNCDAGYCRYADGIPLYQDPERLFNEIMEKKYCEVVCDQLAIKTFTNHRNANVGIQFRTIQKKITVENITKF